MTASYKLLAPHWFDRPGVVYPAGYVLTEGAEIPVGWVPSSAVDPQNSQAITNFWNAAPASAPFYGIGVYPFAPSLKPVVYWVPVPGASYSWILTGAGAALGPKGF